MVNGCRCWARVVVTRKSAWHWLAHPYCIRWYEEGSTSFGWSGEETEPSGTDGKTKEKRRPRGRRALSALLYFAATLRLLLLLSGHEFITSFVWRVRVSFAIHYSCGPPRPWGMRKCWGRETGTRSRPRSWAGGKRCTRTSNKKKILGRRTWRHCTAPRYSLSWSLSDVEKKKNLRETHCCCCWCCSIFPPFLLFFWRDSCISLVPDARVRNDITRYVIDSRSRLDQKKMKGFKSDDAEQQQQLAFFECNDSFYQWINVSIITRINLTGSSIYTTLSWAMMVMIFYYHVRMTSILPPFHSLLSNATLFFSPFFSGGWSPFLCVCCCLGRKGRPQ